MQCSGEADTVHVEQVESQGSKEQIQILYSSNISYPPREEQSSELRQQGASRDMLFTPSSQTPGLDAATALSTRK